jgi:hypothetical protein
MKLNYWKDSPATLLSARTLHLHGRHSNLQSKSQTTSSSCSMTDATSTTLTECDDAQRKEMKNMYQSYLAFGAPARGRICHLSLGALDYRKLTGGEMGAFAEAKMSTVQSHLENTQRIVPQCYTKIHTELSSILLDLDAHVCNAPAHTLEGETEDGAVARVILMYLLRDHVYGYLIGLKDWPKAICNCDGNHKAGSLGIDDVCNALGGIGIKVKTLRKGIIRSQIALYRTAGSLNPDSKDDGLTMYASTISEVQAGPGDIGNPSHRWTVTVSAIQPTDTASATDAKALGPPSYEAALEPPLEEVFEKSGYDGDHIESLLRSLDYAMERYKEIQDERSTQSGKEPDDAAALLSMESALTEILRKREASSGAEGSRSSRGHAGDRGRSLLQTATQFISMHTTNTGSITEWSLATRTKRSHRASPSNPSGDDSSGEEQIGRASKRQR